jgi:hypothetical protein
VAQVVERLLSKRQEAQYRKEKKKKEKQNEH